MALGRIYIGNTLFMDGKAIADAIGSEAANALTFTALVNFITTDKQTLADSLVAKGVVATGTETLADLAAKVATVPGSDPAVIITAVGDELASNATTQEIADAISSDKQALVGYLNLYGLTGQVYTTTLSTLIAQLNNINATRYYQLADNLNLEAFVAWSNANLHFVSDVINPNTVITVLSSSATEAPTDYNVLNTSADVISFNSGYILSGIMSANSTGSFTTSLTQTMTSNVLPSGIADASSSNTTAFRVFDGTSTPWTSTGSTGWVSYKFPISTKIKSYNITGLGTTADPKSWTFEGSNDGTTWDILNTQTDITGWAAGVAKYYATTNDTSYLYYRLNVTLNSGGAALSIYEIKLNAGLVGIASATNILSSTFDAWKAFNRTALDINDGWKTNGTLVGALGYQFPTALVVNAYELYPINDSTNGINSYPKSWTFEGSNDGTTWDILDTQTNQKITGYTVVYGSYILSNTTAYTYYRINITANNGNASYTSIGELKLECR